MSESPQGEPVRMKLNCRDREHFLSEFAPKMSSRVFVPLENPPAAGSIIALHIRFQDGEVQVRGTAEVIRVVHSPRDGVHVRFTALDADSIQFPLGLGRDSGEHAIPKLDAASFPSGAVPLPGAADVTRPGVPLPGAAPKDAFSAVALPPSEPPKLSVAPPRASPSADHDVTKPGAPPPRPSSPSTAVPLPGAADKPLPTAAVPLPGAVDAATKPGVPSLRPSSPSTAVPLPGGVDTATKPGVPSPRPSSPSAAAVPLPGGTDAATKPGVPSPRPSSPSTAVPLVPPPRSSPTAPVPLPGAADAAAKPGVPPPRSSSPTAPVPLPGAADAKAGVPPPRSSSPTAPVPLPGAADAKAGVPPPRSSPTAHGAADAAKHGAPPPRSSPTSSGAVDPATKPGVPSPRSSAPLPPAIDAATKPGVLPPRPSAKPAPPRPSAPRPEPIGAPPSGSHKAPDVTLPRGSAPKPPAIEARPVPPAPLTPFDSDHDTTSTVNVVVPAAAIPPAREQPLSPLTAVPTVESKAPVPAEARRPDEARPRTQPPRPLDIPTGWAEPAARHADDTTASAPPAATRSDRPPEVADVAPPRGSRVPLIAGGVVLLLILVAGGAFVALNRSSTANTPDKKAAQADSALSASLARIDERMMAGAYTGPGGDSALDHLRAALKAAPADARVKERQQKLAALFEQRAGEALAKNDHAEAAVQLTALLMADPSRSGVKERLADAEAQVKRQAKKP